MAVIELEHITVAFDDETVVNDVSFTVDDGEFAVLVGPSGSGKTTLLRTITGYAPLSSGRVMMGGQDVTSVRPRDRDIAMVFQNLALYPHLSVRENWEFPLKAVKMDKSARDARIRDVAEMLQMTHFLHRLPSELSGGQKQRVAMGRALVRQPQIFLLDEPLGALDAKLRVEARSAFKALQRDLGITTVYVTHDQIEAQALGTKIIVLDEGEIQQIGPPEQIYDSPTNRFVAGLFGSPPMNFIDAELVQENGVTSLRNESFSLPIPDQVFDGLDDTPQPGTIAVGIRPETIDFRLGSIDGMIPGTIYVSEPAGNHVIVDVRVGEDLIRIRTSHDRPEIDDLQPDTPIGLRFDPARMQLFDQAGRAISRR